MVRVPLPSALRPALVACLFLAPVPDLESLPWTRAELWETILPTCLTTAPSGEAGAVQTQGDVSGGRQHGAGRAGIACLWDSLL